MKVWVNGELIDQDDSQVGAFDHGLTVGDGVFETIAVRGGQALDHLHHGLRRAFGWDDHTSTPSG